MKHNLKITALLLIMFVLTQAIGMLVLYANPLQVQANINGTVQDVNNPYLEWVNPPKPETQTEFVGVFSQLLIAFVVAIVLLFLLIKFKIAAFLKFWFFAVVSIALFLSFIAFEKLIPIIIPLKAALVIAIILSVPLAFIKIYKRNILVHNLTELLIYPGIAVVFDPLLNLYTVISLLLAISIYDMWAVWRSGVMQKMAKYQINNLKIFSGFFVPYMSKKVKMQIEKMRNAKIKNPKIKEKNIKVSVAILGGGDIIFPIITAGVMFKLFGLLPAIFVILGATLGLTYLFFFAEKKKFYPAMPFITSGILLGMLASLLF